MGIHIRGQWHGARPHWGQHFDPRSLSAIANSYPDAKNYVEKGLDVLDPSGAFANDVSRALRKLTTA